MKKSVSIIQTVPSGMQRLLDRKAKIPAAVTRAIEKEDINAFGCAIDKHRDKLKSIGIEINWYEADPGGTIIVINGIRCRWRYGNLWRQIESALML